MHTPAGWCPITLQFQRFPLRRVRLNDLVIAPTKSAGASAIAVAIGNGERIALNRTVS